MKIRNLFTIYGILLFSACSEDFVLTEPWKDIPVVYGLINRVDSAQYIRVEKLFVDENIPAVDMAKVADSIYYKNAKVYLINLTSKREVELKKVDGTSEGYPRNSGPFAQVPNILYKLKTSQLQMAGGDSILLKIDRGDGKTQVTSRIQLVRDFDFTSPPSTNREVQFKPDFPQSFSWQKPKSSQIFDFDIIINVQETNTVSGNISVKPLRWVLKKGDLSSSVTVGGLQFYNFLKENLIVDPAIKREILRLDFKVRAGGPEVYDFNSIVNANTGITASQEIPRYSNMSEGFGLFSSIHQTERSFGISLETKSLLKTLDQTRLLGF
ncbi:MAG: DUF4249 family protein [Saprospiraceae bacterium]|nr:DUF4249 family protein [Candidatus Vicinibacter affinis]